MASYSLLRLSQPIALMFQINNADFQLIRLLYLRQLILTLAIIHQDSSKPLYPLPTRFISDGKRISYEIGGAA